MINRLAKMSENRNKKVIIIPTYNEAEIIQDLIKEIFKFSSDSDILIVDDNSPDGTGKLIDKVSEADRRVSCLHRPKKEGIGPAYVDAFKRALRDGYQYIMQMDADFSHDPRYIPRLFDLLSENDLVIGSRYIKDGGVRDWGVIRKFVSRCGSIYPRWLLDLPVNDLTAGFKCFKREVLEGIDLDKVFTHGYAFQIEITYKAHLNGAMIREYPIIFSDRRVGKTKMTWGIFFEAIFAVWRLRFGTKQYG